MQINTNMSLKAPAKPRLQEQRAQQIQASAKGKISAQPHTLLCMQKKLIMHALYCL